MMCPVPACDKRVTADNAGPAIWFLVAWLVLLLGCGKGQQRIMAPVAGRITYAGKALPHGQITMIHNSGQMGSGEIQPNGTYQLEAQVGENRVMIRCMDDPTFTQTNPAQGVPLKSYKSLIPAKYADYVTSGLTINVTEGQNSRDWKLVD